MSNPDAVVVGAGPNGLAGALTLARAGLSVRVIERAATVGGGARTSELTLPGFLHDECSAVHPMAVASPFFRSIGLADKVDFITPPISFAHPFDSGESAVVYPDVAQTAARLTGHDGQLWQRVFSRLSERIGDVDSLTMGPLFSSHNVNPTAVLYGLEALRDAFSRRAPIGFDSDAARSLLLGSAAHLATKLPSLAASAGGLALALQGQVRGWPIPRGGSQSIVDALVGELRAHGAEFVTGHEVRDVRELGRPRIVLLDVGPRALGRMVRDLPAGYSAKLDRMTYGPGTLKVDYALSEPVPWSDPVLAGAGTLHLGARPDEIIESEREIRRGRFPATPFVIASQPSLFDPTRAPAGLHTFWAYSHAPSGWPDPSAAYRIDAQIERFAPGFLDTIIERRVRTARQLAIHNPNAVGGDFSGGTPTLRQLVFRPTLLSPWRTPAQGVYLASSSTPPGPAVHGMCGHLAAQQALWDIYKHRSAETYDYAR